MLAYRTKASRRATGSRPSPPRVLLVAAPGAAAQEADLLEPTFPIFIKPPPPPPIVEPASDDESLVLDVPGRYSWAVEFPDPGLA